MHSPLPYRHNRFSPKYSSALINTKFYLQCYHSHKIFCDSWLRALVMNALNSSVL